MSDMVAGIIGFFKPKAVTKGKGTKSAEIFGISHPAMLNSSTSLAVSPSELTVTNSNTKSKPKPTRAQLGQEITFDLMLTRLSLMVDIIGHALVACLPAPSSRGHHRMVKTYAPEDIQTLSKSPVGTNARSEAAFVLASAFNSFGAGSIPAIHSLALCLMQLRVLGRDDAKLASKKGGLSGDGDPRLWDEEDDGVQIPGTGELFGALAVLQAIGQMILGVRNI